MTRPGWALGYRVHLTETCDADTPHLITQIATVLATTNDSEMTAPIQDDLAARAYLPAQHLLDAGYVTAQHLLRSADAHDIAVIGPVLPDTSWQANTPGASTIAPSRSTGRGAA